MPPPPASQLDGARLVVGLTGSIAAYKAADLVRRLMRAGADVQPVMTPAATRFVSALTLGALTGRPVPVGLWPDAASDAAAAQGAAAGAANGWTQHVALGTWADGIVVAPCTAQTLAALAAGHCDSMLTAVVLSARCPVLVVPAMDHDMWHHPATQRNVATLRADGVTVLDPAHGALASGLVGDGRMPEPEDLVPAIDAWLAGTVAHPLPTGEGAPPNRKVGEAKAETEAGTEPAPRSEGLAGRHVMVTAGPTREALDPVRFLSNGSTGTMGFEIAAAAARRGARVTLLAGPVALATPPGVRRVDVTTADDLLAAALAAYEDGAPDLVIAAAAVSDYAPVEPSERKLKKSDDDLTVTLRRTPDVLAALGQRKAPGQTLVGFALETHDGEAHARGKMSRKHLDWIVLNAAGRPGEGFGTGTNRVTLLAADGRRLDLDTAPKRDIAEAILDAVTGRVTSS